MGYEERNAWVYGLVTVGAAGFYLLQVLGGDAAIPLEARDYKGAMLYSIGGAIVATILISILVNIVVGMVTGDTDARADLRDRQIGRFGDYVGQSLVIVGAVGALILVMLDQPGFWVAQAIYFGFVASGALSAMARIASYRFGFAPW